MPPLSYVTSRDVLAPPGAAHWLGTNDIGQDVVAGLILALPNTVLIAIATAFLALAMTTLVAAPAALRGGWLAAVVMRVVDILQVVPSTLVLLLVAAWIRPDFLGIVLLLAITAWHDDVRVLYAVFRRELTRENVRFARHMGASWTCCFIHHILPSVWPTSLALFVQHVRYAAMRTAGLAFLGLMDPRLLTWGGMLQDALDHLYKPAWLWLLLPPAICLSLFLLAVLAAGQWLEDIAKAGQGTPK